LHKEIENEDKDGTNDRKIPTSDAIQEDQERSEDSGKHDPNSKLFQKIREKKLDRFLIEMETRFDDKRTVIGNGKLGK
jgi:hypothetical protein